MNMPSPRRVFGFLLGLGVPIVLSAQAIHVPGGAVGTSANGNVGIGTSTPAAKFEILDTTAASGLISRLTRNAKSLDFYTGTMVDLQIGTSTNSSLGFYTNDNNPLLVLSTSQKVGIGTTTPTTILDAVHNANGQAAVYIQNPNAGAGAYSEFGLLNDLGPGERGSVYKTSSAHTGAEGANSLNLVNAANARLGLGTHNAVRLTITGAGDVGIGTATPATALDVVNNINSRASVYMQNLNAGAAAYGEFGLVNDLGLGHRGSLYKASSTYTGGEGANSLNLLNASNAPLGFGTAGVIRMTVTGAGNVGIGTAAPAHRLAVNGAIRAKEVIVDTGWADFVFADDYKLPSLAEVETHIKERRHLPGIPPADEVAAGGVSLGDMQAKLLQKIEELTLHQIAQEKQFRQLQSENAALRERLNQLEKAFSP